MTIYLKVCSVPSDPKTHLFCILSVYIFSAAFLGSLHSAAENENVPLGGSGGDGTGLLLSPSVPFGGLSLCRWSASFKKPCPSKTWAVSGL